MRLSRAWQQVSECVPQACVFDFVVIDMGARYHGPSGFVFEAGLPIFGWIPGDVHGPGDHAQLSFYSFPTTAILTTISVGYAFDL